MKLNKEGENISATQGTELVMAISRDLTYVYIANHKLYINGKYTLFNILNTPPQVGECMLQTPNLCRSVRN